MTRYTLVAISIFIILISALGLAIPQSVLGSFLTINQNFTVGRLALAAFMLFYGLFRSFRLLPLRALVGVLSLAAIATGTIGILVFYLLPIDIFLFLAIGIYGCLACIELPTSDLRPIPLRWLLIPRLSFPHITKSIQALTSNRERVPQA